MSDPAQVLVYDFGLTNCKAAAFSAEGQVRASASAAYPTYHPTPGSAEQNPAEWWQAAIETTHALIAQRPSLPGEIEMLSVTGHMHALAALDADGEPLIKALVLGDQRSSAAAQEITVALGLPAIYSITGARMEASMPAAKIRWLRHAAPGVFKQVSLFTGCKDFIRGRMTGDRLTDPIDACALSLYDIYTRTWSAPLLTAAGCQAGQLPQLGTPVEQAGGLLPGPAAQLGLRAGTPVVIGGGDDIEVLATGLLRSGITEHIGTTGSFLAASAAPIHDPNMALELYPHAEPGLWVVGGSMTAAGSALAWAAQMLGYPNLPQAMADAFSTVQPGDARLPLFLPHLSGERSPAWNPQARGAWLGLAAHHSRAHLMYAALEGVAAALKRILEQFGRLGIQAEQIIINKHQEESAAWLALRASIYDAPLAVMHTREPTALGAFMLGAVCAGLYPDLPTAAANLAHTVERISPDPAQRAYFAARMEAYRHTAATLPDPWQADLQPAEVHL